jgi:hypothetical protein
MKDLRVVGPERVYEAGVDVRAKINNSIRSFIPPLRIYP